MAVVEKLGLHLLIVVAFGLWSGRVYALELNPLQVPHQVENVNGICGTFVWPRAYDCAEFMVPTKDGFLLSVQRMFGRRFRDFDKEPVFLYHGIMQGGDIWVLNEPRESLAFLLADVGYDVWIGSTRSSTFSYGHITYNRADKGSDFLKSMIKSPMTAWTYYRCPFTTAKISVKSLHIAIALKRHEDFWDWNWDDLVAYDLPAMLHFVNAVTMKPILYVGFSQGSMSGFAAFTNSEISSLVKKAAMLSPIAYLEHVSSPLARYAAWLFIDQVDLLLGMYEFTPSGPQGSILLGRVCRDTKSNCYHNLQTLITGTPCCTNNSRAAYYNRFELQSTSMKNLAQMAQLLRSGRFGKYDYGVWGNLEHYWSIFPPSYDLSAIPERISFFLAHGGKDQLGDEEDVRHLVEQLPGEVKMLFMPSYNHGDFMLGTSAHVDVYPFLLEFFYQN
eukprot:Gb_28603 [translate_table: standard]